MSRSQQTVKQSFTRSTVSWRERSCLFFCCCCFVCSLVENDMASLSLKVLPSAEVKELPLEQVKQQRWSPYTSNGGTVLAVAGKDFCVIGGDSRMSSGYSIHSRTVPKVHKLTDHCVIATGGMQAEALTLWKILDIKVRQYEYDHGKIMTTPAIAQLLSTTLYYKRFFPYYTFNVVGGLDEKGTGAVYGYDAIGSFERIPYGVTGTGSALITSLLDNQVAFFTQSKNKQDLSLQETVDLVKDCFTVCCERDIYTGDFADLRIITKDGIQNEQFPLKKD